MFEDVSLQPPEHVRAQHVVQLLDLVLLGDVSEFLQEDLQFAADRKVDTETEVPSHGEKLQMSADIWRPSREDVLVRQGGCEETRPGPYLNLSGVRKLSRWKSSSRLFCSGVPVSSSLCCRG